MKRPRIKFCGLTRAEDVLAAVALGVDAVGFVLTRRSRRFVEPALARELRSLLPPFVSAVALFMDDEAAWVGEATARVQPDLLQFHGSETEAFAREFGRRWLKAVPMASVEDVAGYAAGFPAASGFLLDSHALGRVGGTGEHFDWARVPHDLGRPLILAGGLDAANVGEAIRVARPWAVDVSSGIESAPGIKDAAKMRAFVAAVAQA